MDLYEAISKRRTIRDFSADAIDEGTIKRIIDAGMKAPTNDHMRDWHFVVVTDKAEVARIISKIPKTFSRDEVDSKLDDWQLHDPIQRKMYIDGIPKQYKMLCDSACLLLPFYRQSGELLKPANLSALNAFASIWCCIENILLAVTAEGYAAALRIPLGDEEQYVKEVLGCPEDYVMPCYLSIGKAAPDAKYNEQKTYSLDEKIHHNRW